MYKYLTNIFKTPLLTIHSNFLIRYWFNYFDIYVILEYFHTFKTSEVGVGYSAVFFIRDHGQ